MKGLFEEQIAQLELSHFLILYWTTLAEDKQQSYNLTNIFDDLKAHDITRTKQNAIAYVEALKFMCFVEIKEEKNRKNIYLTSHGAKALERLIHLGKYNIYKSTYLKVEI